MIDQRKKVASRITRLVFVGVGLALINSYFKFPPEVVVGMLLLAIALMPED